MLGALPIHDIDAMGAGHIFFVGIGGQLILRNLEVRNGFCTEGGPAVLVTGIGNTQPGSTGKLLALNVLFYNNSASGNGGAIMLKAGGALHVRKSVFDLKQAAKGGAVFVGGSDDSDSDQASCGLTSCAAFVGTAFKSNWTDWGGAVYVDDASQNCANNGSGKFECTTCSFRENFALDDGGALFLNWKSVGSSGNVNFSSFFNNTVEAASERTGRAVAIETGQPGSQGVEFDSYQTIYSERTDSEVAVAVKTFANATFTHDRFLTHNAVAREGTCQLCSNETTMNFMAQSPEQSMMQNGERSAPAPAPSSHPGVPPPMCEWVPRECTPLQAAPLPHHHHNHTHPPASSPIIISPRVLKKKMAPPPPGATSQSVEGPAPPPPASCICNCPAGRAYGDPHFYGKHGELFDFHGRSGGVYCVVADKDLQINFISMLGVLYKNDEVLINLLAHTNASRPSQQWAVSINNVDLDGGKVYLNPNNDLNLTSSSREVHLNAAGAADLTVSVIPGTWGRRGSGANYLNLKVNSIDVSPSVHGILGQSYQETKEAYMKLHEARRMAPSRAFSVLLDGTEDDYLTTGILAPDCKFAIYQGGPTFAKRVNSLLPFSSAPEILATRQCTGVGDEDVCQGGEMLG